MSTNLLGPGGDTNNLRDTFVHDRQTHLVCNRRLGARPPRRSLAPSPAFLLQDRAGDTAKRMLQVQSKDSGITTVNPTRGGAQLTLVNPVTHETDTYNLPASGWKGLGRPAGAKGYQYKDRALGNGPCKTVLVKPGKLLKASCQGSQIGFSLNEASQGALGVAVTMANDAGSLVQCLRFGGTVSKDKPAAGSTTGVFQAKDAPPPSACAEP